MTDPIDESVVAPSLMREVLSLLDAEETAAADHFRRAIEAVMNLPPANLGAEIPQTP